MVEFKDVPDLVIFVELKVSAHLLAIMWMCQVDPTLVIPGRMRY
jgi:hypothetical protein